VKVSSTPTPGLPARAVPYVIFPVTYTNALAAERYTDMGSDRYANHSANHSTRGMTPDPVDLLDLSLADYGPPASVRVLRQWGPARPDGVVSIHGEDMCRYVVPHLRGTLYLPVTDQTPRLLSSEKDILAALADLRRGRRKATLLRNHRCTGWFRELKELITFNSLKNITKGLLQVKARRNVTDMSFSVVKLTDLLVQQLALESALVLGRSYRHMHQEVTSALTTTSDKTRAARAEENLDLTRYSAASHIFVLPHREKIELRLSLAVDAWYSEKNQEHGAGYALFRKAMERLRQNTKQVHYDLALAAWGRRMELVLTRLGDAVRTEGENGKLLYAYRMSVRLDDGPWRHYMCLPPLTSAKRVMALWLLVLDKHLPGSVPERDYQIAYDRVTKSARSYGQNYLSRAVKAQMRAKIKDMFTQCEVKSGDLIEETK